MGVESLGRTVEKPFTSGMERKDGGAMFFNLPFSTTESCHILAQKNDALSDIDRASGSTFEQAGPLSKWLPKAVSHYQADMRGFGRLS